MLAHTIQQFVAMKLQEIQKQERKERARILKMKMKMKMKNNMKKKQQKVGSSNKQRR
jgi:hypothetical protein